MNRAPTYRNRDLDRDRKFEPVGVSFHAQGGHPSRLICKDSLYEINAEITKSTENQKLQ
jgi:hypothetical protein